ncbi:family 78 glycoside hydrolase catalytic domain [Cohnella sp. LGH]|uniref:alpha-L-rhamnosidase n=1 Tax=Cohnella sp. LGH TaxID=1619153 RepID=UPI001ADB3B08|nr:alpha-L-rhamnosidase [Cohnella sp. LGH]QTH41018.1 family 78 glycoside hydrolase catalytic domain [Cohnella sp. LGH]
MTEFSVRSLTCEYREALLGTDVRVPRFGWKLESDRRGTIQTAYRVQVAESEDSFDAPTWDSGRIDGDQSVFLEYGGPAVRSRTRYYYRVKAWDNHGRETEWSRPCWWETGLLSPEEWKAEWITPDPEAIDPHAIEAFLLRTEFCAKPGIRSARIYATAAGVYELYANGARVGEDVLAPGWTSYRERHQYQTYDVTDLLRGGENVIGITLGDGWYKGELTWLSKRNIYGDRRAALLQLCIGYEDGSEEWVVTDRAWEAATGAIRMSELYAGELYDARMARKDWSEAGEPDGEWHGTVEVPLGYGQLVAQENDPTRVTEKLAPQAVLRTPQGDRVLDMGQNLVGRMRFSLDLSEGAHVRLRHAEVLDKDGNFYTGNLRKAKQTVEYIAGETGRVSYAPHFTFQGFRYVLVEGLELLSDESLKDGFVAEVLHTDMEPTGLFESSNARVNRLQQNIVWGQRGNFLEVPTDCPQRDERLGWTGDAQVFIRTAAFNYHVGPFFTKWLRDLKADQRDTGSVPYVVPNALEDYTSTMWGDKTYTSSAWGDAATVCPWTVYQVYGDRRLLEEQYGSMKAWVEFIRAQGDEESLWNTGFHFGDWLALDAHEGSYFGATPVELVATAYYALSTRILRDAAAVLGKDEEAGEYGRLLEDIVAKFRETFHTSEGRMAALTQTANILPLVFGLVDGEDRKRIAADLNELVRKNGYHLDTGFVGTPYLCLALSENGYHDTAVKLLLQDTYPSWLYSITKGATTIWEHWDGIKPDGTFWSDDMNSYNHYAYGAIGDWMYRYVAGLDLDDSAPAYKLARIRPGCSNEELTFARASFESAYGRVASGWRVEGGEVFVDVDVPANAGADILLPGAQLASATESGSPLQNAEGVRSLAQTEEGVRLTVGSGSYRFRFPTVDAN